MTVQHYHQLPIYLDLAYDQVLQSFPRMLLNLNAFARVTSATLSTSRGEVFGSFPDYKYFLARFEQYDGEARTVCLPTFSSTIIISLTRHRLFICGYSWIRNNLISNPVSLQSKRTPAYGWYVSVQSLMRQVIFVCTLLYITDKMQPMPLSSPSPLMT
jgi:hypothetical protein